MLVEVVSVCVALVVVVVLVFAVFDFVVFCIFIMMTKTETRATAMSSPSAIVDNHLVANAGEVPFSDTLPYEHWPEAMSLGQPEEMPPLAPAPASAEGGGDMAPPKAPTPASRKRAWAGSLSAPEEHAGARPESLDPLMESHRWRNTLIAKNEALSEKQEIIKNMSQELKEKDQELDDKREIIKSMAQIIKDKDEIIKHKNQELRIKSNSIRAINEEFEQQQAQVKVWEQEVTIGDMVIGVVVNKKRRVEIDIS